MNLCFNGKKTKIFLTFFALFSIFIHWVGWNEESRLALARAIVMKNRFQIDEFAIFTGDRFFYKNHYYSDKAPGTSFLLTPIVFLSHILVGSSLISREPTLIPQPQFNVTIYLSLDDYPSIKIARIFGVVALSSLPGGLIVLMIYKIILKMLGDKKIATLSSMAFGLGTVLFNYSSVLFGNILGLLLVLITFYLLFLNKNFRGRNLLSGILLGLAFLFEYTSIVASFFILLFFLLGKCQTKKYEAIVGFIIGLFPLFLYNYMIFNTPFSFTFHRPDPAIFPCAYGAKYYSGCNELMPKTSRFLIFLHGFISLLFYPYRGLFFYSPFLFFSFIGFYYLYKKSKILALLSFSIFLSYLVSTVIFTSYSGGSAFGPRYLICSLPFLSLPFAYCLKLIFSNLKKNRVILLMVIFMVFISIFHKFLGDSGYWEGVSFEFRDDSVEKYVSWYSGKKEVNKSIAFLNPLYEHYLPAFLQNGPRSRVLEQAIIGEIPDIRDFKPMPRREIKLFTLAPFGILVLKIPFLSLFIVLAIVTFIWQKELKKYKKLYFLILVSLFILFLSRLSFSQIVYGKEFYPLVRNETVRWFGNQSTVYIFSNTDGKQFLNISLIVSRLGTSRSLSVYLNGKSIGKFYGDSIFQEVYLRKGENILELKSSEPCEISLKINKTYKDPRCLSFGIRNLEVIKERDLPKNKIIFGSNWYGWEQINGRKFRWASSNASIYLFSEREPVKVNITLAPYKEGRLIVFANEEPIIDTYLKRKETILSKTFEVKEGINKIVLSGECKVPFVVEKTPDKRCLAFFLYNFSIIKLKETPNGTIFYNNKFYEEEIFDGTKFRWLSNDGEIDVISFIPGKLSFLAWTPPNFNTTLKLKVSKIFSNNYKINPIIRKIETPFFIPKNEIVFKVSSEKGCTYYKDDPRCLSIAFGNVTFIPLTIENIKGKGFYGLEKDGFGRSFRWINDTASLEFFSLANITKKLKIEIGASYFKPRTLQIYWNDKLIKEELIYKETSISLGLNINKGKNTLLLKSKEGCDIPALKENSSDRRCLSFMIRDIEFE